MLKGFLNLAGATLMVLKEALISCELTAAALRKQLTGSDSESGGDCLAEQAVLDAVVTLLEEDAFM